MIDKTLDRLRSELDDWQARLDNLRVQAKLGKMEARDQLLELVSRLEPTFREAETRLEEIAASGSKEARILGKSLLAGWRELLRTHRESSAEAQRESSRREARGRTKG
jgi:hypothetical protein